MQLQEELLVEILAQLPVKSLIRFTCVCKYWHSIITSSEFATKHYATRLKMNRSDNNNGGFDSILTEFSSACSMYLFSYEDLKFETAFKFRPAVAYDPPKFGITHRDIISCHGIYGPCNGLFLLEIHRDGVESVWLLWNPAIRDVFRVPRVKGFISIYVGFGFDDVTNDYKIVCFDFNAFTNRKASVLLYSFAGNSWRKLDLSSDIIGYGGKPHIAGPGSSSNNGRKHHWMMYEFRCEPPPDVPPPYSYSFLLSFDMVDEVFVQTLMPYNGFSCHFLDQGSHNVYPTIYYMVGVGPTTEVMHIWGLNKYGPTGSWSKLKSFLVPNVISSNPMIWKNKAILFANNADQQAITQYDLTTEEMTLLQFLGDKTILAYTQSLVSVAKFVRRPPPDYSSVARVLQDNQHKYYLSEFMTAFDQELTSFFDTSIVREEEYPSLEMEFQQLLLQYQLVQKNNDDGDDSSTDSAFLMPVVPSFPHDTITYDYETDLKFSSLRAKERERLFQLPYCLCEVNQPMSSNPCTF